jgi:hypothetical protein
MVRLDEAENRYEALRERDRVIASLQSKQRVLTLFEHLLDAPARDQVQTRLAAALESIRDDARRLALELARAAFTLLQVDDLVRITQQLRKFSAYLDEEPSERLGCCHDLLTFIREMRELDRPPKAPVELD